MDAANPQSPSVVQKSTDTAPPSASAIKKSQSHMSRMGPVDYGAFEHQNVHPRGVGTVVDHAEQGHKPR
jgi:hypothetical protein